MRVFKFGGASVKSAGAVKNVATILRQYQNKDLVVILSAMGKMTNAFEAIVDARFFNEKELQEKLSFVIDYHSQIVDELFSENVDYIRSKVDSYMSELEGTLAKLTDLPYDLAYDQIVPFGELISTTILSEYLKEEGIANQWADTFDLVQCDNAYREAKINWETTNRQIKSAWENRSEGTNILLSQGFLGRSEEGKRITLGREGSDFSAAIFAYALDAEEVTIWKDVEGLLNADPKFFENTIKLDCISYHEAIELAYYGATVIHPKTIKPLENKEIPLIVRSFMNPEKLGSLIQRNVTYDHHIPSYIFKKDQLLISITPRDFSFVAEQNLHDIFGILAKHKIRINLMQNSAISFSLCVDHKKYKVQKVIEELKKDFIVRYNEGLELITIRHYNEEIIEKMIAKRRVLVEQRSRTTVQLVIQNN